MSRTACDVRLAAASGICEWADRCDREFSNIFVVQEEIAHAIAAAMHVPLGLKQRMVRSSTKLWHPSYSPLYRSERFKALVRSAGLEEYWRKRGGRDSKSLAELSSAGEH